METQMNKPEKAMSVLGFFLTFLMVISLITGGILISVKTTILSGSDINDVLENSNIYGTITDVVVSELSADTSDTGLSKEAIEKVFSEEVLKDAAKTMTNAIKNDEDIDLSGVKNQCMDVVKEVSEQAVDDILDEVKNTSDVISIDVLKDNKALQQIESDYNVDVTTVISDYVEDTYGSTTVNMADIDVEQVKKEAKEALKENVIPTIEKAVDDCIVEVNATVNKQIKDANEEYNISGTISLIESILSILTIFMVVTIALSVVFAAVQIGAIYRKCMNRGFRNVSIAAFLSGIVVLLVGIMFNVVKSIVMESVGTNADNVERAVGEFMESNIGAISGRAVTTGIIYIVIAVICMILAIVLKKKYADRAGNSIVTE